MEIPIDQDSLSERQRQEITTIMTELFKRRAIYKPPEISAEELDHGLRQTQRDEIANNPVFDEITTAEDASSVWFPLEEKKPTSLLLSKQFESDMHSHTEMINTQLTKI